MDIRNRFKGLDLIDTVPDELWMEVHDILYRQGSRPSPRKRNAKKLNGCLRRPYKIAVKRREKERYTHLNAEFQRITRRDKRDLLSDQCEEIEKNNRIGKTRDLFRKIRDTKGTFHTKMGSIKDRNGMDLTEADDTKKR